MKHLTILSGGGSPHGDAYRPVYELIRDEANLRGISSSLIDYVGIGQYPTYGSGLNLPTAVDKALSEIRNLEFTREGVLLCRSFGCDVGAYLMAHHQDEMKRFGRLVLWGPSAFHVFWRLLASEPDALDKFNSLAMSKGVILSARFWETFCPIEESLRMLKEITVSIGFGTKDKYCDAPLANYLAALIRKYTKCSVNVTEIPDAEHEIRPEANNTIKALYFQFIFWNSTTIGSVSS